MTSHWRNWRRKFGAAIDDTGALVSQTYAGNGTAADTLGYTYHGVQLGKITGEGVTTNLGYNTAGEQTSVTDTGGAGVESVSDAVTQQDDQGRPTQITGTDAENGTGPIIANGPARDEEHQIRATTDCEKIGHNRSISVIEPGGGLKTAVGGAHQSTGRGKWGTRNMGQKMFPFM